MLECASTVQKLDCSVAVSFVIYVLGGKLTRFLIEFSLRLCLVKDLEDKKKIDKSNNSDLIYFWGGNIWPYLNYNDLLARWGRGICLRFHEMTMLPLYGEERVHYQSATPKALLVPYCWSWDTRFWCPLSFIITFLFGGQYTHNYKKYKFLKILPLIC